jgi:hypothetical protein
VSTSRWPKGRQAAGLAGIVFGVLSAAIFPAIYPDFPPPLGGAASEIVRFHGAHGRDFLIGNYLGLLAMIPGLFKLSYLVRLFRMHEAAESTKSLFVLCTGVFAFGVSTCDLLVFQAIPFVARPGLDAGAKAVSDIAFAGFAIVLIGLAGFMWAIAWANEERWVLPRWLTRAGIPLGIVSLAGSVGACISAPSFWAGGGAMSSICLGAFLVWFFLVDLALLGVTKTGDLRPLVA